MFLSSVLKRKDLMNFNPNESSLHLLFREDTFKYCIVSEKNTIVSLKTFHENNLDTLKTLFSEQNELNQSYKKVRVSVYDPNRTLVPVDFFDFNELRDFLFRIQKRIHRVVITRITLCHSTPKHII